MTAAACLWCGSEFAPRPDGGKAQRFCRPACRRAFDRETRAWARRAIRSGRLVVVATRSGLSTTRAFEESGGSAAALQVSWHRPARIGEADMGEAS